MKNIGFYRLLLLDILFVASSLYGQYGQTQQIATSTTPYATAYGNGHKIALDGFLSGSHIYVVYASVGQVYCIPGEFDYYSVPQWSSPQNISSTTGNALCPAITLDTTDVPHIVWRDTRDGNKEIYHSFLQIATWSTPENVSQTAGNSTLPSIDADNAGCLHLVYADSTEGNWEIYYQRYQSGTWTAPVNISNNTGVSFYPSIGIYHDSVFVCWEDNSPGNYEIFRRICASSTWSSIENISNNPFDSRHPSLSNPSDWDQGFSVAWKDSIYNGYGIQVLGCNGGSIGERTIVADYPVISNVGTTWSYMAWEESDSIIAQIYYFMHGWCTSPCALGTGFFPNVAGDNYIWTGDSGSSYAIMYSYAGYPIGVNDLSIKPARGKKRIKVQPNPFTSNVQIAIEDANKQQVLFEVYDILGRKVRSWKAIPTQGTYSWNGRNDSGNDLTGGLYFLRAIVDDTEHMTKMIKVK